MKTLRYVFLEKEFNLSNPLSLSNIGISDFFQNFIENENFKGKYLGIITKVKTIEGKTLTIGLKYAINLENSKDFIEYANHLKKRSSLFVNWYNENNIVSIVFIYTKINETDYTRIKTKFLFEENKILQKNREINLPFNIPLNNRYFEWGNYITEENGFTKISGINFNINLLNDVFILIKEINSNEKLITFNNVKDNTVLFYFSDSTKFNQLIRFYNNKKFILENEKVILYLNNNNKTNYINKLSKATKNIISSSLMTLDIETYLNDKKEMHLYCVSTYNGNIKVSYYLNDFNNINDLLNKMFRNLFVKANNGKYIFIHNSSEFDLIFLLKHLVQLPYIEVNPVIKDGKFINLEIKYSTKNSSFKEYSLTLRDSILLLPSSLENLAKSFKINTGKGIFPYSFVNENNLDYKGEVPDYKYFDSKKVSLSQYLTYKNSFKNKIWNLRKETIKYCEQDSVILFNVIEKFGSRIFKEFKVNIYLTPTLPSLAFRIYRTQFMKNNSIPILTNKFYNDLVNAFFGGHCDVYIPSSNNKNIYCYDVNGLYPYAMKTSLFPTKILTYFIGDITKDNYYHNLLLQNKALGIFKVKVQAPLSLKHPILPKKIGDTTVYGVGTWTGWYYSEELNLAKTLGYEFEILSGYIFKGEYLFEDYVNTMNKMKENSEKNSPSYTIAKLLLNSLYGRFSMSPHLFNHIILDLDSEEHIDFLNKIKFENIESEIKLGNKILISYSNSDKFSDSSLNVNIAIGIATSSYARIHMSKFKNNPKYNLYYTDTDSIYTDQPLPSHLLNDRKLGCMKLENVLTDFVAIAPKVYGGVTVNGEEFTKVKGFKDSVSFIQLKSLLNNDKGQLKLMHQKWINQTSNSLIKIKDSEYNLKPTTNKRELIFRNNTLVGTKSKVFKD